MNMDAPGTLSPEKKDRYALEHYSGRQSDQTPWESEGLALSPVEAVLYRNTTEAGVSLKGQAAYGLYIRLGDQWFKAFDIPANDPCMSPLRGAMRVHGVNPERLAADKRERLNEAKKRLHQAEMAYQQALED